MNKSDKELAVEIVIAHLNAWSGEGKKAVDTAQLPNLIQTVYDAIHKLPD
jgi:predicted transcriptional regulator